MSDQLPLTTGPPPGGWCWATMDPRVGARVWRELAGWVGWLRGRYPVAERIPVCWWRHSELVEELTALWLAWHEAYLNPSAVPTAPMDFHTRHLPGTLERIRTWGVQCAGQHRDRPAGVYDPTPVDDATSFLRAADSPPVTTVQPGQTLVVVRIDAQDADDLVASSAAQWLSRNRVLHFDGSPWLKTDDGYARVSDPFLAAQLLRDAPTPAPTPQNSPEAADPWPGPSHEGPADPDA